MKKLLAILSSALIGLTASAQSFTGTWEVFPNFSTPTAIVETPDYVYTLAGSSLIGYDKATNELAAYNTSHRLNGNSVSGIWYDPEAKYLFVTYSDDNIDLVFDDGRTINVPDLRDAAVNTSKAISTVGFYDNKAYVGTGSGLIVVDARHGAVIESCLWGKKVDQLAVTPGKLLIYDQSLNKWFVADRNVPHHNFNKVFAQSNVGVAFAGNGILSAHGKIAYISGTTACMLKVDDEAENADAVKGTANIASGIEAKNLQVTNDGFIFGGSGKAHRVNAQGEVSTEVIPAKNMVASWTSNVWLADATGICQYIDGAATPRLKPNSTSGSNVGIFRQTPDGTVYLSTLGVMHSPQLTNLSFGKIGYIDTYKNGKIERVLATDKASLMDFVINPKNEDEILVSFFTSGVKSYNTKDNTNRALDFSSVDVPQSAMILDLCLDSDNALWCLYAKNYSVPHFIKSMPHAWTEANPQEGISVTSIEAMGENHSSRMIIDAERRNVIATGPKGLSVAKMPSADDPIGSDTKIAYCSLSSDEDGNTLSGYLFPTLALDKKGWLWIGSEAGIRVIRNTDEMFNSGCAPMRPKVPRNDGTNLADYLLDQVEVLHVAVDENDDKWISTNGSGLYHVNADGTEIVEHFTTSNSEIPSDLVIASYPDKFSNKIFVGTDQGLAIYHSTSAPAKADLSNVYAYPNPVTPEFTGHINVAGLMDGTLVKIADASGNVFYQATSNGGMITWNGCDAAGQRVKSGVYYVFASKSSEGEAGYACVTKIVVVN